MTIDSQKTFDPRLQLSPKSKLDQVNTCIIEAEKKARARIKQEEKIAMRKRFKVRKLRIREMTTRLFKETLKSAYEDEVRDYEAIIKSRLAKMDKNVVQFYESVASSKLGYSGNVTPPSDTNEACASPNV